MKPVDQDSFSDESAGTHGNCYAACITLILERPLADLAEFNLSTPNKPTRKDREHDPL